MEVYDDVEAVVVGLEEVDRAQEILPVSDHLLFLYFGIRSGFFLGVGSFFRLPRHPLLL